MKQLISSDHLFLTSSSDIDAICHPLKQHLGITSVVYQKNFTDGSEIRFSNQPAWMEHFYNQQYYKNSGFEQHPSHYQSSYVVWSHLTHHQPILNAARNFNIDHGMTFIQKATDGCEFYFFGTTPDKPHLINVFLNNIDILQHFMLYFKETVAPLLRQADSQRIYIPNKYRDVTTSEVGIPKFSDAQKQQILRDFKIKKLHLNESQVLSRREWDCVRLLMQGKTYREISNQLFISPRTVETHLQHIKEKLHCHTKSELIAKLLSFNIRA